MGDCAYCGNPTEEKFCGLKCSRAWAGAHTNRVVGGAIYALEKAFE